MQKKTGIWEGSIWEYLQPPILYSWYSCWYCIFFLDKGFLGITKAITILSSQKNYPRHSLILEEKPRRNKYIFGANIKIINLYTTLQLFHKKISYRAFWCIMSLLQNITKESDPVRQRHYTTKRLWLVDFTNIFWFILKLFLLQQQILCFYSFYQY